MSGCILCHEGHGVPGKVVSDHEDIYHFGLLLQFLFAVATDLDFGGLDAAGPWGPVASIGTSGALTLSPS